MKKLLLSCLLLANCGSTQEAAIEEVTALRCTKLESVVSDTFNDYLRYTMYNPDPAGEEYMGVWFRKGFVLHVYKMACVVGCDDACGALQANEEK